ncbi:STAS domain-containing protein [Streptomyces indicus]|uniref:Anti-anti-sigma factor n=1 Tax=Streptomyces indicus TaxID=417292 RepID=A0A1G9BX71_9ACTN|nr:STAS domain-containing protein [Streptomyces indicus]SDK43980.1 anti-anti-sigma factor [Streptomyces indicus]
MDRSDHWPGIGASYARGPLWVIELKGDFDHENVESVAQATALAFRMHEGPVAFDMKALTFCDSSLLNHVLRVARQRRLLLVAVPQQAMRVFELTGTCDYLEMCDSVAEAVGRAARNDG